MSASPRKTASSQRKNPNSRNSELKNPLRRSFSGNPFAKPSVIPNARGFDPPNTRVNSPSDLPQRHSTGRESLASLSDYDDKENGKDQIFMSPMISAASKANASLRKKTLVERNGSFRSSDSCFDAEGLVVEDSESRQEMSVSKKMAEECSLHCLKSGVEYDSRGFKDECTTDEDLVNLDPTFKISPRVSFSPFVVVWTPVDADPSMPPYDPKSNYHLQGPQFLHYKPKHQIIPHQGKEGTQVMESFQSDSFSDSGVTEEIQSEDSQRELALEDAAWCKITKENEGEEELHVSEPPTIATDMAVEGVEAKRMSKPGSFSRSKFIALLLALAFTYLCISATDLATFAPPQFEGLSSYNFQIPIEVSEFARSKFDGLVQKLQHWLANARSYILKKISGLSRNHTLVHVQYAKLSSLLEYNLIDAELKVEHCVLEHTGNREFKGEPRITEAVTEEDNDIELKEDIAAKENETGSFVVPGNSEMKFHQAYQDAGAYENHEALLEEQATKSKEECQGVEAEEIKVNHPNGDNTEGKDKLAAAEIGMESQGCLVVDDLIGLVSKPTEILSEESTPEEPSSEKVMDKVSEISPSETGVRPGIIEVDALSADHSDISEAVDDKFPIKKMAIIPWLVLVPCLIAATATTLVFLEKGKRLRTSTAAITMEQPLQAKTCGLLSKPRTADHRVDEKLPSSTWQTNFDPVSESCPSEMGSFWKSSSHKKGLKDSSEAQSLSLASSDYSRGDSPSYGSFMKYERIPSKHGGDEEIVTPVRRSSRIRNQTPSS